ncbi:MAG: hypothetical protein JO345_29220 [Streptosporangiaceae bacterium]|nr:hypothetical protein [Streptosporangiaceae bacterium]
MAANAYVGWIFREQPWELEDELIGSPDVPLNLEGHRCNPFHPIMAQARAPCLSQARTPQLNFGRTSTGYLRPVWLMICPVMWQPRICDFRCASRHDLVLIKSRHTLTMCRFPDCLRKQDHIGTS